jgi:NAD-dependent SIR2 family protein deacetylase
MFFPNQTNHDMNDFSEPNLEAIRYCLQNAQAVLIGAGAGLSAAAGLLYADLDLYKRLFPGYHERYGLTGVYEGGFYPWQSEEEQLAYWARHIHAMRFQFPLGKPYVDLLRIVREHDYFVFTTNVDGQFHKAGFDIQKLATPQGDYGLFQCSRPCHDTVYPNQELVKELCTSLPDGEFSLRPEQVPRCQRCGAIMEPNIRKSASYIDAHWQPQMQALQDFVQRTNGQRRVFLEIGVGFNTPGIIRYPFERMTLANEHTTLIRINAQSTACSPALRDSARYVGYEGDAGALLASLC